MINRAIVGAGIGYNLAPLLFNNDQIMGLAIGAVGGVVIGNFLKIPNIELQSIGSLVNRIQKYAKHSSLLAIPIVIAFIYKEGMGICPFRLAAITSTMLSLLQFRYPVDTILNTGNPEEDKQMLNRLTHYNKEHSETIWIISIVAFQVIAPSEIHEMIPRFSHTLIHLALGVIAGKVLHKGINTLNATEEFPNLNSGLRSAGVLGMVAGVTFGMVIDQKIGTSMTATLGALIGGLICINYKIKQIIKNEILNVEANQKQADSYSESTLRVLGGHLTLSVFSEAALCKSPTKTTAILASLMLLTLGRLAGKSVKHLIEFSK